MSRKLEGLLTPGESVVALIDYQPQLLFGVGSHERHVVLNNAVALAKATKLFDVPVILTTIAAQPFSAALLPEIQAVFPDQVPLDPTTMNSWEDKKLQRGCDGLRRKEDRHCRAVDGSLRLLSRRGSDRGRLRRACSHRRVRRSDG